MQTEQLNIRVSKELVKDLDVVSNILKVSRSEWIKTKLSEEANKEKNRLLMELSTVYAKGMIKKEDVERLVGREVFEQMEAVLKTAKMSVRAGKEYGRRLKAKIRY